MNKAFKNLLILIVLPLLVLLNGCTDSSPSEPAVKLERIDIVASPTSTLGVSQLTLATGSKQPFEAVGYYSDGSSLALTDLAVSDWHSSDQDVGAFDTPGVLVGGKKTGTVAVSVTRDGITSNTVTVNVTAAVITNITVPPSSIKVAEGQTKQLTAMATYSDNTSADVTNSVVWQPVNSSTVTVTSEGLLSGISAGNTALTAAKGSIISNTVAVNVTTAVITDITITPSSVKMTKGQTQHLTAIATYSDNTSADVTNSVIWVSTDTTIATVTANGSLSGLDTGSTTLEAMKDGITSNTVNVDVTAAVVTGITVTPPSVKVAKGQTQQFTAIATYSDNTSSDVTDSVAWVPTDTSIVTVTSNGLLSGVSTGNTTLIATKDGIISNTANVDITAAVITGIIVTPSPVKVAKGQTQQLTATAIYSDNTSSDVTSSVTWVSNDTSTATMTQGGLLSGAHIGKTTLTAIKDNVISPVVNVDVTAAVVTEITVTPSSVNVQKGQTEQLTAIATYSDNTSSDVTTSVTWIPIDTATAIVTSDGLLSGEGAGATTLTAVKGNIISNTVDIDVTAAKLSNITLTPVSVNVAKGHSLQLMAMATYSDNTTSDVTNSVTWKTNDNTTATVTWDGLLSGVNAGSTTLTATKDNITSNTLNVTVCDDLAGPCIDIVDTGDGTLFTNSPSVAYLDNVIGTSATDGSYTEKGRNGPAGEFYIFNWDNANALCSSYRTQNIGGRSNWRLAEKDELKMKLFDPLDNMFNARDWPTFFYYWSKTPDTAGYYLVALSDGGVSSNLPYTEGYASCISEP